VTGFRGFREFRFSGTPHINEHFTGPISARVAQVNKPLEIDNHERPAMEPINTVGLKDYVSLISKSESRFLTLTRLLVGRGPLAKNVFLAPKEKSKIDVTKHRTGRTGAKYRSWVLVKCVWCCAYY